MRELLKENLSEEHVSTVETTSKASQNIQDEDEPQAQDEVVSATDNPDRQPCPVSRMMLIFYPTSSGSSIVYCFTYMII